MTQLDDLLQSIDPARSFDPTSARVHEALSRLRIDSASECAAAFQSCRATATLLISISWAPSSGARHPIRAWAVMYTEKRPPEQGGASRGIALGGRLGFPVS
jgi:hypothetical protein